MCFGNNIDNEIQYSDRIFIKGDKKYHQINIDDILYIQAFGAYCNIVMHASKIITLEKISTLEEKLNEQPRGKPRGIQLPKS